MRAAYLVLALGGLLLLSACGGGGGDGTPPPAQETAPPGQETPTPEVITVFEEEEAPDLSGLSFIDNLLAKEEAGEWTRGEGLVATLKLFAGELDAAQVLRHPDLLNNEGTGILKMAYEYLEDGPDAQAKAEITRLLDLLVFSNEQLEAMAGLSPPTAGLPGQLAPGAARGPAEDCLTFFHGGIPPGVGQCLEVQSATLDGKLYRVFHPAPGLPTAGWTEVHYKRALEAMKETVPVYLGKMPGKMPAVNLVFSVADRLGAEAFTKAGEPCGVAVYTSLKALPPGDFKQYVAHELAHCLQTETFAEQDKVDYEFTKWREEGLADYLSNVVYPAVNLEWGDPPEHRSALETLALYELNTTVFDRAYTNFLFFQYLYHLIGNDGIFKLIGSLPNAGGRAEQEAALAAYPGMDTMYHDFARAMTDGQIEDTGDELIPYPIDERNRPTVKIAAPQLILEDFRPFDVSRIRLVVAAGKEACLRWSEEGLVVDARPTRGGDWSDLPSTLPESSGQEGDIIVVVTATTRDREFELEATHVAGLSGGGGPGGAGLVGEWVVVNDSMEGKLKGRFPETRLDAISGEIRATFRDDGKVEVVYENFKVEGHSEGDSILARILGAPDLYTERTITTNARGTTSYKVRSLPPGDFIRFGSFFEENYLEGSETVESYRGPYELGVAGHPIPVDEEETTEEREPLGVDLLTSLQKYDFQCGGFILRLDPGEEEVILYRDVR